MEELSFFNIGFRCENISETLNDYINSNGKNLDKYTIEDSIDIIKDCFSIRDNTASFLSSKKNNSSGFIPVIFEYFENKSLKEMISDLQEVQEIVTKLELSNELVNIQPAIKFFEGISDICISKSSRIHNVPNLLSMSLS